NRVAATFGQALSLGIAALALATGPTFAFGVPINTPAGTVPPVGSQVQPSTPPVNPLTVPADSVPTLVQVPAQYSPQLLDFGTLKGYQNEQRTATLKITAPADGAVSAFIQPQSGAIQV